MIGRAHCDINVTTACNAACVGCSHLAPIIRPALMTPERVTSDLAMAARFLRFTTLCAVGGEPTTHPRIDEILRRMRSAKISDEVMIITNGRNLTTRPETFWDALAPADNLPSGALRLSVYPGLDPATVEFAKSKCEERKIRFEHNVYTEFFAQFKATPDDGAETFARCVWKNDCYTIHLGRLYRCPQSVFFSQIFHDLVPGADGHPLDDATEESIRAFLDSETPLTTCRRCSGGSSHPFQWSETRDKKEWLKKATI